MTDESTAFTTEPMVLIFPKSEGYWFTPLDGERHWVEFTDEEKATVGAERIYNIGSLS